MSTLIEVRNLTLRFPGRGPKGSAVNSVTVDLAPGVTVALVGESGGGKSIIGLAIMGLAEAGDLSGGIVLGFKAGKRRDLMGLSDRAMQAVRGNEVAIN